MCDGNFQNLKTRPIFTHWTINLGRVSRAARFVVDVGPPINTRQPHSSDPAAFSSLFLFRRKSSDLPAAIYSGHSHHLSSIISPCAPDPPTPADTHTDSPAQQAQCVTLILMGCFKASRRSLAPFTKLLSKNGSEGS